MNPEQSPSKRVKSYSTKNVSWSHSKISSFELEHTWKIDMFGSKIVSKNKSIETSKFSAPGHDLQFRLSLDKDAIERTPDSKKSIDLFFECYPGKTVSSEVTVQGTISILKNDDSVGISKNFSQTFLKCDKHTLPGFAKYSLIMDSKNNFLVDKHQLKVCCKAKVFYKRTLLHSFTGRCNFNCKVNHYSKMKTLLESGNHSDVTIIVDKTKIPVHKTLLIAQSPVFDAMFSHDETLEAQKQEVNIPDVSLDVMKDFLLYIYTGAKPKSDRLTINLLAVADRYEVLDLKTSCENNILSCLTLDNVVNTLVLADMYNAHNLKENCLSFITSNFDQVMLTKDWVQLGKTRNDLMVEACTARALKIKKTAHGKSVARPIKEKLAK